MLQTFDPPRVARIANVHFAKRLAALTSMGLKGQDFRVTGSNGSQVFVHPDDLLPSARQPFLLRADIVEFVDVMES